MVSSCLNSSRLYRNNLINLNKVSSKSEISGIIERIDEEASDEEESTRKETSIISTNYHILYNAYLPMEVRLLALERLDFE